MKSDTPLDYAVFQLSPKRSRCELLVSSNGNMEKLASGLVKPFVSHLKVAEEQAAHAVQTIKLEVEQWQSAENWFTKGTLERFVRFVSTPEVLELVSTLDAEMSQLEAARRIYSLGAEDRLSGSSGGAGEITAADATKKELLRAIDVRLTAVKQDLTAACARASAAGFNPDTVSDLQLFSDEFGANRLNEACTKFISLCGRRPDLINPWKPSIEDQAVRASWGSDMSIDEPTEDATGRNSTRLLPQNRLEPSTGLDQQPQKQQTEHLSQSKPSACQQPKFLIPSHENNINEDAATAEKSNKEEGQGLTESPLSQPSKPLARRLSVQDRINLFENKQKEQSGSSSGGNKPIVEKPVLRRLSSDVSSSAHAPTSSSNVPEKAILRRWSAVSDMSIDLGNDKDSSSMDSSFSTPTSSSISQAESNLSHGLPEANNDQKGLNHAVSSNKAKGGYDGGFNLGVKNQGVQNQGGELLGKEDEDKGGVQIRSFTGSGEQFGMGNQVAFQEKLKGSLSGEEKSGGFNDLAGFENKTRGFSNQRDVGGERNRAVFQNQIETSKYDNEFGSRVVDAELKEQKNQPVAQSRLRGTPGHSCSQSGQFESVSRTVPREAQYKGTEHEQLAHQPQWRSLTGEVEEEGKREPASSGKEQIKAEDSEVQRMKKSVAAGPELIKKAQGRRDDSGPVTGNNKVEAAVEQVQRVRQSKGNQELNDELKIKATELEKLFAEHKLRVPGDQSSSARSKPSDIQDKQALSLQFKKPPAAAEIPSTQLPGKSTSAEVLTVSSSNPAYFSTPPTMKMVDHIIHSYSDTLGPSFSDDSRGKFYETYMQKRDEKLREEWSAKRAEKEARLKVMHDSLERSRAELKAKFSDTQDSVSSARRRAEKVRSLNMWSDLKREQHPISSIQDEDDGDVSEFMELKYYGQDRSFNEASLGDGAYKSSQTKKPFPNKNLSSSTPRNTVVSVSRSSAKVSNPTSGRRRPQPENPLAQSVPNFSDLRKENTKPSSGTSKITTRSQLRNYPRSKSTNEDVTVTKEEKSRRSQHSRKSSATDMPPMNSDNTVLAPLSFEEKFLKDSELKPFLRKGNGIGGGSGIPKLKASMATGFVKDEEEYDEMAFDTEDMGKDDEGEPENVDGEEYANMDNGKERLSQESDKLDNSGSENDDSLRSLSHVDPSLDTELPASVPSAFQAVGSLQDSPGESPVSWTSRMRHQFSYPHEASDVDGYLDSPIGSPASWNSHSLAQTEADAARMRKKWGSAQKPFFVTNSSQNQPRKDMTKGFKRLLKFGRKNRGTDNMVDWISATTSEGDDDTEDGRDPASRSSEDLRKSRMGFSHGHPSDDSFNENDMFNEHVQALNSSIPAPPANFKLREDQMSGSSIKAPRSFFSLSTFRSKGSDSKPR